jgi:hypothetical protein
MFHPLSIAASMIPAIIVADLDAEQQDLAQLCSYSIVLAVNSATQLLILLQAVG